MKRLLLLALWAAAIYSLSRLFEAGRTWREELDTGFVVATLGWLALLAGSVFVLTLRMYAIERRRGHVVRQVGLFERLLEGGGSGA